MIGKTTDIKSGASGFSINGRKINNANQGSKLFFIVNDALVKKDSDLDGCEDEKDKNEQHVKFENTQRMAIKKIYDEIKIYDEEERKNRAAGIYYLNNKGNFVVNILQE